MADRAAERGPHEREIGLQRHLTSTPPLGGHLRGRIEDFRVDEVFPLPPADPAGRHLALHVRLMNWETNAFIREASQRFGISRHRIHFSGTKDKRGVTTQWFSVADADDAMAEALAHMPGVQILDQRRLAKALELGDHLANRFQIVLRGVKLSADEVRASVDATWKEIAKVGGVPNAFGPQRFGARRATTHRVGERMIRGDFVGAVRAYLADPIHLPEATRTEWMAAVAGGDWKRTLALAHEGDVTTERALLHRMVETQGDAIASLLVFPPNLQRLFVYAFQSWLFNEAIDRRLGHGLPFHEPQLGDLVAPVEGGRVNEEWIPVTSDNLERCRSEVARGRAVVTGLLPGTEAPLAEGDAGKVEREVLAAHALQPRDFLVPEHVEWSSKGTRRAILLPVEEFTSEVAPDELTPGASKVVFSFRLPPGAYATAVLREFSKSPWLVDYA